MAASRICGPYRGCFPGRCRGVLYRPAANRPIHSQPLVGATGDGPSDAAVLRPVLDQDRAIVLACGMNPYYGDLDPYAMAAAAMAGCGSWRLARGSTPPRVQLMGLVPEARKIKSTRHPD